MFKNVSDLISYLKTFVLTDEKINPHGTGKVTFKVHYRFLYATISDLPNGLSVEVLVTDTGSIVVSFFDGNRNREIFNLVKDDKVSLPELIRHGATVYRTMMV